MKYEVTYSCGEGIFSANIAYAADREAVAAWYERKLKKPVVGIREMLSPFCKPGQPVVEIPMTAEEIKALYPV